MSLKDTNEVVLEGYVVSKFASEKVSGITVRTKHATSVENFPRMIGFGPMAKRMADEIEKGNHVLVRASLQSQTREEDGHKYVTQSLVVQDFEKSKTMMEEVFGLGTGGAYMQEQNRVALCGTVSAIDTPREGMIRIHIRTRINNFSSNIQATYYTNEIGNLLESIRIGDRVCATGTIQTARKEYNGEMKNFQNVVLNGLQKVDKAPETSKQVKKVYVVDNTKTGETEKTETASAD